MTTTPTTFVRAAGPQVEPTERQRAIARLILEHCRSNGMPPTIRWLCGQTGIKVTNGIVCHLNALRKKGWLSDSGGGPHDLFLTDKAVLALEPEPVRRVGDRLLICWPMPPEGWSETQARQIAWALLHETVAAEALERLVREVSSTREGPSAGRLT